MQKKVVEEVTQKLNITTEAVTKRLISLSTQYCKVIKLVGCNFFAWSYRPIRLNSTQLVVEILNLFRLTRLTKNWTISVELSSKSALFKTQLNCQLSWVEFGPALWSGLYVVNSSDLKVITPGNSMCKYADDTCLTIPSANEDSRMAELENVES